jgi:hypothetical protein
MFESVSGSVGGANAPKGCVVAQLARTTPRRAEKSAGQRPPRQATYMLATQKRRSRVATSCSFSAKEKSAARATTAAPST